MDWLEYFMKNTTFETNVWLVASHHGDYQDGVAAGAYCGSVNGNGLSGTFWGSGGVKNTETLFAYGIAHVVQIALAEDHAPLFPLHVFIHNNGVRRYLREHVPAWVSNGGLNSRGGIPDAYQVWKDLYLLTNQRKIVIDPVSPSVFSHDFSRVQKGCNKFAKEAFDRKAYRQVGVFEEFQGQSHRFLAP